MLFLEDYLESMSYALNFLFEKFSFFQILIFFVNFVFGVYTQ